MREQLRRIKGRHAALSSKHILKGWFFYTDSDHGIECIDLSIFKFDVGRFKCCSNSRILLTALGEQNLATEELLRALQIAKDTNTFLWFPMDLGYLGSAYAAVGDLNAGRKYLDDGIEAASNSEERIFEAELFRRRGETFVQSDPELAEGDFLRALEIARSQDARLWELRAAVSLATMWRAAGKRQNALNLLCSVYPDFTEGFETADLKRAKQLIDALAQ